MTSLPSGTQQNMNVYTKNNKVVKTPREIERDAIAFVTHHLKIAHKAKTDKILTARAVSDNLTLWYVLMTDLASETNQLPPDLRARLISVGMTVVRECEKLNKLDVDLNFLIVVNQSLIDGLAAGEGA